MTQELWLIQRMQQQPGKYRLANAQGGADVTQVSYDNQRSALADAVGHAASSRCFVRQVVAVDDGVLALLLDPVT